MVAENGSNIYRDDGKRYQLPGLSQLVQNFKIFSGFEPKLNIFSSKNCNLSGVLNELMQLKRHKRGLPPGDFCDFFEKKKIFYAIWITFYTFLKPFEKTKLLKFGSHLKQLNCPNPNPYLQVKFKTGLNACMWD